MSDASASQALRALLRGRLQESSPAPCVEEERLPPVASGESERNGARSPERRELRSSAENLCVALRSSVEDQYQDQCSTPVRRQADDSPLAELSLSDSEPSMSPLVGASKVKGSPAAGGSSSSSAAAAIKDDRTALIDGAVPLLTELRSSPQEFEWLHALPREVRRQLRCCFSLDDARTTLAIALGVETDNDTFYAPEGLVNELQRRTQAARRRVLDLEDELQKQRAAQDAEIAVLFQEQRRSRRRAKLDLLAQIAPHGAARVEDISLASSPAPSTRGDWDTSLHLSAAVPSLDNSRISATGSRTSGTRRPNSAPRTISSGGQRC